MSGPSPKYVLRDSPAIGGARVETHGSSDGLFQYFIYADVLEELRFAAEYREEDCVALLEGAIGVGESGPFVEIDGFSGLEYVDHFPGAYRSLRRELKASASARNLGQTVSLGVFVAAKSSGARLTADAVRLQMSLFNLECQVVLMIDPEQDKVALYNQVSPGAFGNIGFSLVHPTPALESAGEKVVADGGDQTG
jgi:hypothetical protein